MSAASLLHGSAHAMALAVRSGHTSATALVQASLDRIAATQPCVNAFTEVLAQRALARAGALDAHHGSLKHLPFAGVPFAVKNLFDVRGLRTLAGSKIERDAAPATQDAVLIARLEAAGAVLVGALNMDEYAYGFTNENAHAGPVRNPHDPTRIAGGSSGGSAAAVAAGQVPLTLGSDTNGSIRVPASLCGVFGLKPTFGRLPRTGSYPFVSSLDHLGPFARNVLDLALAYDTLQGADPSDPSCSNRPHEATVAQLAQPLSDLRIGILNGYFERWTTPAAAAALSRVALALGARQTVELPMAELGRAAAFITTNAEAGALHLSNLRTRPQDFEPLSRDRLLAGALLPAAWVARAQRVRRQYALAAAEVFQRFDVLLAPATPCPATPIGEEWLHLAGQRLPLRPSMGLLTQPISCIGLPVCAVPVIGPAGSLPMGVQIITAPWREDRALRVAAHLEAMGVVRSDVSTQALTS